MILKQLSKVVGYLLFKHFLYTDKTAGAIKKTLYFSGF